MKIAVPVNEKKLDSGVCPSFGRAPYFVLYDTDAKECSFLDNSAAGSQGGAGIKAAQMIADHGVRVLLAPRCGENAIQVLNEAEISVYKTIQGTARENVDDFNKGNLQPLDEFHAGFHGHEK
jgi:predicted Fe-Mo cluster-binding NifX family protein